MYIERLVAPLYGTQDFGTCRDVSTGCSGRGCGNCNHRVTVGRCPSRLRPATARRARRRQVPFRRHGLRGRFWGPTSGSCSIRPGIFLGSAAPNWNISFHRARHERLFLGGATVCAGGSGSAGVHTGARRGEVNRARGRPAAVGGFAALLHLARAALPGSRHRGLAGCLARAWLYRCGEYCGRFRYDRTARYHRGPEARTIHGRGRSLRMAGRSRPGNRRANRRVGFSRLSSGRSDCPTPALRRE
jgi:hypothetical protein